jgi:hypothetical protein
MNNTSFPADRRQRPYLRKFVRFEFVAYLVLHLYTCYIILYDYGVLFAVIALICPVIPELYMFVMGVLDKKLIYVSVFSIFALLVIVNALVITRRSGSK